MTTFDLLVKIEVGVIKTKFGIQILPFVTKCISTTQDYR